MPSTNLFLLVVDNSVPSGRVTAFMVFRSDWIAAGSDGAARQLVASTGPLLAATADNLIVSRGRTRELLHWSMVNAPVCVASFAIGIPWGLERVALAYAIGVNRLTRVAKAWAYKGTELHPIDALAAVRRPYALSALMFAVAVLVQPLLADATTLSSLMATTAVSGIVPQSAKH